MRKGEKCIRAYRHPENLRSGTNFERMGGWPQVGRGRGRPLRANYDARGSLFGAEDVGVAEVKARGLRVFDLDFHHNRDSGGIEA